MAGRWKFPFFWGSAYFQSQTVGFSECYLSPFCMTQRRLGKLPAEKGGDALAGLFQMMSKIKAPSNLEPILLSEESRLAKTKKPMQFLYISVWRFTCHYVYIYIHNTYIGCHMVPLSYGFSGPHFFDFVIVGKSWDDSCQERTTNFWVCWGGIWER